MGLLTLILQLGISGSIMALPVLLLRLVIWKKLPPVSMSVLWTMVLAFFLIPINFSSPISVRNILNTIDTEQKIQTYVTGDLIESAGQSVLKKEPSLPSISVILTGVWLLGMLILAGYYGYKYIQLYRSSKAAVPLDSDGYRKYLGGFRRQVVVYKSDRVGTAITFGIIKPKIILSGRLLEADGKTVRHVLLHEAQHIRHFDSLWGMIWLSLLCIHWFNPIAWLCWIFARKDRELFCDVHTVKQMEIAERADYARTILDLTPVREPFCVTSSFGSLSVKSRIIRIISYRPSTRASWVGLAGLLCILLAVFAPKALNVPLKTSFISFASPVSADQIATDYTDTTGEFLLFKISNRITNGEAKKCYRLIGSYNTKESALNTPGISDIQMMSFGFGFADSTGTKTFIFQGFTLNCDNSNYVLLDQFSFKTETMSLTRQAALSKISEGIWS